MGIGAVFGAMNTMYAVLALIGGSLGCLLALPANGLTTATAGPNFAQLAFAFRITVQAVASGLVFAVVMGVCGGLLPALRGARLSIINALRGA
jgi:putative ABC transport system permease protein